MPSTLAASRLLLLLDNFEHLLSGGDRARGALGRLPEADPARDQPRGDSTSRASTSTSSCPCARQTPSPSSTSACARPASSSRRTARSPRSAAGSTICRSRSSSPPPEPRCCPPPALLERLEQRLPLLTGGARDLPERQRTLRATIDWSHELLSARGAAPLRPPRRLRRRLHARSGGRGLRGAAWTRSSRSSRRASSATRMGASGCSRRSGSSRASGSKESGEADAVRRTPCPVLRRARGAQTLPTCEVAMRRSGCSGSRTSTTTSGRSSPTCWTSGDAASALHARGSPLAFLDDPRPSGRGETMARDDTAGVRRSGGTRRGRCAGWRLIAMEQGDVESGGGGCGQEALTLDRESGDEEGAAQSTAFTCGHRRLPRRSRPGGPPVGGVRGARAPRRGLRMELAIALYNLGHVARLQGKLARAEALFRRVARELPRAGGHSRSGWGAYRTRRDRSRARRQRPRPVDAHRRHGALCEHPFRGRPPRLARAVRGDCSKSSASTRRRRACRVRATTSGTRSAASKPTHSRLPPTTRASPASAPRSATRPLSGRGNVGAAMTLDEAVAFALKRRAPVPDTP